MRPGLLSNTLAVLAVSVVTALASCGDRAIKSPTDGGNMTGAGGVAGTGIAGAGGTSSVLVPPFESETPTSDCSAVARAFSPPVVVDVVLTCPPKANFANVAIGTADQGFVAYGEYFRPPARLVTIAPSGGISESLGPSNSPALQVCTDVAGAPCAVSVGNEHASVGFYRLYDRGWWASR